MLFELLSKFLIFGLIYLLIECIFTGITSIIHKRDIHGTCHTYLSMIPIGGTTALTLDLIRTSLDSPTIWIGIDWQFLWLAPIYLIVIYMAEFISGWLYEKVTGRCPWKYGKGRWTIMGFVNLEYFRFWLFLALCFNPISVGLHKFYLFLVG